MSEEVLSTPKIIRQTYHCLEQTEASMYQLAALLHRIYYKSKAQHRATKWFKTIDGMRKCFSKLLEMDLVRAKVDESLPDRGTAHKDKSKRRKLNVASRQSSICAAKQDVAKIWNAFWGEDGTGTDR
ncbi:hypothetical protein CBS101457_003495 [Exobasidium rhododendri]|nr:hypothetical protein CBS101457_003495 [Exobasidium rhododendri]